MGREPGASCDGCGVGLDAEGCVEDEGKGEECDDFVSSDEMWAWAHLLVRISKRLAWNLLDVMVLVPIVIEH